MFASADAAHAVGTQVQLALRPLMLSSRLSNNRNSVSEIQRVISRQEKKYWTKDNFEISI